MVHNAIDVFCVLVTGGPYTPVWVNRLHRAVKENLKKPFSFYCITDTPDEKFNEGIFAIPSTGYPGWWEKTTLFCPVLHHGNRSLFLDLDVIVTGPLDDFVDFNAPFGIVRQWKKITSPKTVPLYKSAVMAWDSGAGVDIYTKFHRGIMDNFRGDQDWIATVYPQLGLFPDGWVVEMKDHRQGPPPEARVVLCNEPKNDELIKQLSWFQRYWHD